MEYSHVIRLLDKAQTVKILPLRIGARVVDRFPSNREALLLETYRRDISQIPEQTVAAFDVWFAEFISQSPPESWMETVISNLTTIVELNPNPRFVDMLVILKMKYVGVGCV